MQPVRLWPLPLIAAALPAAAILLALGMYTGTAAAPSCNPFIEGCVSISRMARQGLANHVFRALVLPGAVFQLLTWLIAARALADAGLPRRDARLLAIIGAIACVALVLYGTFLGTDGDIYRLLRRTGTAIYFGGTYLALLLFARSALRLHAARQLDLPRSHARVMLAPLIFIALLIPLSHLNDRTENLTEWWGSMALIMSFVTMAAIWRRWGIGMTITTKGFP